MTAVICPLSIVPVRKDPSDRAEMITQWLFGETAEVLEKKGNWTKLVFDHDGYEGWVDNKQIALCSTPNNEPDLRVISLDTIVDLGHRQVVMPYGSVLPFYQNGEIVWQDRKVPVNARTAQMNDDTRAEQIEMHLHPYLGAPYLWGGRTPAGIDCSGLMQMLYIFQGIYLPRDASEQAEDGDVVELLDLVEPGDLAFFDNEEGMITHVGMVLTRSEEGDLRIAHASGRVRIDTLDQQGIYNKETKSYSHKLRMVKRVQ